MILPSSETVRNQAEVELSLLKFLKERNPQVCAIWESSPLNAADESDASYEDCSSNSHSEAAADSVPPPHLLRRQHREYVLSRLGSLPSTEQKFYPQRPFVCYWALQTADLLGLTSQLYEQVSPDGIAELLHSCLAYDTWDEGASSEAAQDIGISSRQVRMGFAGGPCGQMPHIIPSFAACSSLAMLGNPKYLETLPRAAIKRWLFSLRGEDGSFSVHHGGEVDVRASYCAAVVVHLLQLDDPTSWLREPAAADDAQLHEENVLTLKTAHFVASCQTHEGGFTCAPTGSEAHGAYTHCALAALLLMKQPQLIHYAPLRKWLCARQLAYEGGFSGRTNKLVDSCYSHWVGSSHVLLRVAESFMKLYSTASCGGWASMDSLKGDSEAPLPCLLAKEVVLLDSAQLLDITGISCSDEQQWDREETRALAEHDMLERFLSADDACSRSAAQQQQKKKELIARVNQRNDCTGTATTEQEAFTYADVGDYYFNQRKLQQYVFSCCQSTEEGGLCDKPGCNNDSYHTCYSLSGVSGAQNLHYLTHAQTTTPYVRRAFEKGYIPGRKTLDELKTSPNAALSYGVVMGMEAPSAAADVSLLRSTNPIFNIHRSRVVSAMSTWGVKTFI